MEADSRRLHLRVFAKIMIGIAFFVAMYVVLAMVFGSNTGGRKLSSQLVDLSQIRPGGFELVLWEGRPVMIYRRTNADIALLDLPNPDLLDADSKASRQPNWANNAYRSRQPEWFVAIGVGLDFSCPIKLANTGFADECRGSKYDFAGRVYRQQYADENLIVPVYTITGQSLLLGS